MTYDEYEPWAEAHHEFEQVVLPILKKHGKKIGAQAAAENNVTCQKVMQYYEMLYRSFDPMTLLLLRKALEELGYLPRVLHS